MEYIGFVAGYRSQAAEVCMLVQIRSYIRSYIGKSTKISMHVRGHIQNSPQRLHQIKIDYKSYSCREFPEVKVVVRVQQKQGMPGGEDTDTAGICTWRTGCLAHGKLSYKILHSHQVARPGSRPTLVGWRTQTTTFQNFFGAGDWLHISRCNYNAFLAFSTSDTDSRHLVIKSQSIYRRVEINKSISKILAFAPSWHVEGAIFALEPKGVYAI